jgi:hypothetical protein
MSQIFPNFQSATSRNGQAAPIQTKRVTFTGTGSSQAVALSWDAAFSDDHYTCTWSVEAPTGTVGNIYQFNKTASGIVAQLVANFGQACVLHAVAFHD